jgi:hypothetical protein
MLTDADVCFTKQLRLKEQAQSLLVVNHHQQHHLHHHLHHQVLRDVE